ICAISGRSISSTPAGGAPTLSSPELLHSSVPDGLSQRNATVWEPTSIELPLRWTTRWARGWTAGSVATCSASNTPRTLSFPSCERLAASAKSANETCIPQHRQLRCGPPRFPEMETHAGDVPAPGQSAESPRPGVWLTDVTRVLMALIWGVNFVV